MTTPIKMQPDNGGMDMTSPAIVVDFQVIGGENPKFVNRKWGAGHVFFTIVFPKVEGQQESGQWKVLENFALQSRIIDVA